MQFSFVLQLILFLIFLQKNKKQNQLKNKRKLKENSRLKDTGSWKWVEGTEWISIAGGDGGYTAIDPHVDLRSYTSFTGMTIQRHDVMIMCI